MIIASTWNGTRARRGIVSLVATLVLALATGLPLHSAENFLPHSGEQSGPYLGI